MELSELEDHVSIMLNQLKIKFKKINVLSGRSIQFVVEDFGLIICCINRADYIQIDSMLKENFSDWRTHYITPTDDLIEDKYKVLWELMRCGYMKWLRYNFPRQIRNTINGPENLGQRIIEERLRIWNDRAKYKFLIEDNLDVLRNGILRELSNDQSFFDYMPEED